MSPQPVDEYLGTGLPTFSGTTDMVVVRWRGEDWWLGSTIRSECSTPDYPGELYRTRVSFELIPIPPWARERDTDIPDNIVLGEN